MNDVVVQELRDDGTVPNNDRCPLLVYPQAVTGIESRPDPAAAFEELFASNGWLGSWRNGVFPYHHYHSTAHEVLGCYSGSATVRLGGEDGVTQELRAGDAVLIPAGVAHKRLSGTSDFGVVGAYANGRSPDMNYAKPGEREAAVARIRDVPLPDRDPVHGADGPVSRHWRPVE
ncbi:MAG: cupin domain-containing protein [Spirochaetota bacterium]